MKLPKILDQNHIDEAAKLVSDYYTKIFVSGMPRTGSRFDDWAGRGDAPDVADRITPDDLIAVSFLSVDIPSRAAIGILETYKDDIAGLLTRIPDDIDLADVKPAEYAGRLGKGSPADSLWHLLRGRDTGRWGLGQTKTSKILARKRPRLIPIYDSVVGPLVGLSNSKGQWEGWYAALTDGSGLPQRLSEIRQVSGIADPISDIRVMDIVLWMYGKKGLTASDN